MGGLSDQAERAESGVTTPTGRAPEAGERQAEGVGLIARIRDEIETEAYRYDEEIDADIARGLYLAVQIIDKHTGGKAETAQGWIPVSERLPEPNRLVLCYITTGATETYFLALWNDTLNAWEEGIGGIRLLENDLGYEVIAWMPLPEEPYKAESEGKE